jgi:hypothetical protein
MLKSVVVIAAAFALVSGSAEADAVYSQPSNNFGSFSSQNDTSGLFGNFFTTYDNFTLLSSANLKSVDFTGSFFNPDVHGTITAFTIAIYADSSDSPGTQLYSTTIVGNAGETFVGTDFFGDLVYSYAANISFAATGGTEYWLSIEPDLAFPPQWGWENSSVGDGLGYQRFFGVLGPITSDSAFTLNDTPVPEPITLSIFGAGLAGAAAMRRRKKVV